MIRIAVVGSRGRLGAAVARFLESEPGYSVTRVSRDDLDLSDLRVVEDVIGGLEFDLLFNSAALTAVDFCEGEEELAMTVNADAPGKMAEIAASKGARMIHVGTDYVYGGEEDAPRCEGDLALPKSAYGRSKLAGDEKVMAVDPEFLVIRTSWVFGPDRPSFLDMMLDRAREHEVVAAVADKVSTPCYSEDFGKLLVSLIGVEGAGGLVNLCNSGSCSWQQYAQVGLDSLVACGVPVKTEHIGAVGLANMTQFVAPRPVFTAMSTEHFHEITGVKPRPWQEAVDTYVRDHYAKRLQVSGT